MSHSKGLFGTCPGKWVNYRRPNEGQSGALKCGRLRMVKVHKCLWFHEYKNKGRPVYGKQKQTCSKCGDKREKQIGSCFAFHGWSGKGMPHGLVRCKRCGQIRKIGAL